MLKHKYCMANKIQKRTTCWSQFHESYFDSDFVDRSFLFARQQRFSSASTGNNFQTGEKQLKENIVWTIIRFWCSGTDRHKPAIGICQRFIDRKKLGSSSTEHVCKHLFYTSSWPMVLETKCLFSIKRWINFISISLSYATYSWTLPKMETKIDYKIRTLSFSLNFLVLTKKKCNRFSVLTWIMSLNISLIFGLSTPFGFLRLSKTIRLNTITLSFMSACLNKKVVSGVGSEVLILSISLSSSTYKNKNNLQSSLPW